MNDEEKMSWRAAKLVPNPAFLPRCEWALRTGLAVALMSALALSPATADTVSLPGFGAFVAVMAPMAFMAVIGGVARLVMMEAEEAFQKEDQEKTAQKGHDDT